MALMIDDEVMSEDELGERLGNAIGTIADNNRKARQAIQALQALVRPCEQLIDDLRARDVPNQEWPLGAMRIAGVLEAIDSMWKEWEGKEIPETQSRFVWKGDGR